MKTILIAGLSLTISTMAAAQTYETERVAGPAQAAPTQMPPAPPPEANLPPVPSDPGASYAPASAPSPAMPPGQWIRTAQYGWIWTPYGREYTNVNASGELAFQYAYYPAYGWRWYPAPWVLGWGPRPYWGPLGYSRFVWYAHPWFHVGVYRPALWSRWGRPYAVRPVARPAYVRRGPVVRRYR